MPGLYTGEIGSLAVEREGVGQIATNEGVSFTAAEEGFQNNYISRTVRAFANAPQIVDEPNPADNGASSRVLNPLTAEAANQRYAIPGVLKFDTDTDEITAKALYDEKHASLVRQDILNRASGAIGTGGGAQFAAEMFGSLLDPIGLAAGVVPIFGEAALGARLATMGIAGRTALRAGAGFVEGAAGMAALEPLNYALDQREHNDWTMGSALRNLAYGGLFVGGLHAGGGLFKDAVTALKPEDQAMALRGAVAQVMEGGPVTVAQALDGMQAARAADDLRAFGRRSVEIADREAPAGDEGAPARGAEIATTANQLRDLHNQASMLEREIAQAREGVARGNLDPVSAERLAAVESDLAKPISKAAREALEAERSMLLEGSREGGDAGLEAARSRSQAEGLAAEQERVQGRITETEARLEQLRAADAEQSARFDADMRSDDAAVRRNAVLNESKRQVVQALTERSVRRYAAAFGVVLNDGDARLLAREITAASRGELADAINFVLKDIQERAGARPGAVKAAASVYDPVAGAVDAGAAMLNRESVDAATRLTDALRNPPEAPDTAAGRRVGQVADARAPKAEGGADKEAAVAEKDIAALEAQIKAEAAAGRISESELAAAEERSAALEAEARDDESLFNAAATCILRNNS